jgi:hypothetical protein
VTKGQKCEPGYRLPLLRAPALVDVLSSDLSGPCCRQGSQRNRTHSSDWSPTTALEVVSEPIHWRTSRQWHPEERVLEPALRNHEGHEEHRVQEVAATDLFVCFVPFVVQFTF